MNPLTNSEMMAFLNCKRGWWLNYYRKLRRVREYVSLPQVGTLYHLGLEKWYSESEDPLSHWLPEKRDKLIAAHPEQAEQITKDVELVNIMLEGYFEWLEETGADAGLTVVGVEEPIDIQLEGTSFVLRGKIDTRLRRDADGALLQLENKTVGDLTTLPRYAQSHPQFLTYDLLAYLKAKEDPNAKTDGVLLNMAKRVKRTRAARPPFYGRYEVRHNVDELRSHYRHVVAIGMDIMNTRNQLDAGYDHHDVCPPNITRNHNWSCNCAPLGTLFDDGSDVEGFLSEFYEEYDPWQRYTDEEDDA